MPEFMLETGEVLMKILVVDDSAVNRRSAEATLVGHEVTILGSYDDAVLCMHLAMDPAENIAGHCKYHSLPVGLSTDPAQYAFDVALLDLMLPASMDGLMGHVQQDLRKKPLLPYGLVMAPMATRIPSVRRVMVVTATNHHFHPMSWALDNLRMDGPSRVNGKLVHYVNYGVPTLDDITEVVKCSLCRGTGRGRWGMNDEGALMPRPKDREVQRFDLCRTCKGTKKTVKHGKDWGAVLRNVFAEYPEEKSG